MVVYTVISPHNTVVVVACATLDRALDLAAEDLTRDWVPAWIVCDTLRLDIDAILQAIDTRPSTLQQHEALAA
jgi:hypothetical protein